MGGVLNSLKSETLRVIVNKLIVKIFPGYELEELMVPIMNAPSSKSWAVFTILVLFFGGAWVWVSRAPSGRTISGELTLPHQGFQAPDFSLGTISGEIITLSEFRGKPVIINLWTSWCPPCRAEMPALQNVYEAYQDQGLVVLAVNATNQDDIAEAIAFAEHHNLSFPILLDIEGSVSRLYQLESLPTTFFVDDNGKIQEIVIGGPMAEALLQVRVERLLEELP